MDRFALRNLDNLNVGLKRGMENIYPARNKVRFIKIAFRFDVVHVNEPCGS